MKLIRELAAQNPAELIWPVIVFLLTFAAGWLCRRLVLKALRTWSVRGPSRAGTILARVLAGPMLIWAMILGIQIALQTSALPANYANHAGEVLYVLWMASAIVVFMRLSGNLVRHYGDQIPGALPVTTLSQNLAQIAVLILGIVVVMDHYNRSITPILTALGVGGLAVALALQDTLSNLFGGFWMAVARQIRLGDYVKLNSGEEGYISDIGWRCTTIRSLNNNMIIVPNSKLAQAIVTNYYLPEKRMSASLQVGVSYHSDPDHVEKVLLDLAKQAATEVPGMLSDPPPVVTFDPGLGDWSLGFTLAFQVAEFSNQFGVRNELRKRIFVRFRQEGIEIPFPTRSVVLEGTNPIPPSTTGR